MIRRYRRPRNELFSFDSFLDVVANVVGIIIRLILVVWVGARSYSSVQTPVKLDEGDVPAVERTRTLEDPLERELARRREELAEAQKLLLEQLRQLHDVEARQTQAKVELTALASHRQELEQQRVALMAEAASREHSGKSVGQSLTDLQERQQRLLEAIRDLEKQPASKKALRYRTPVSQPVNAEQLFFECRRSRVSFIDIHSLLAEAQRDLRDKEHALRSNWQLADVTNPVGAFRLRYLVARERDVLSAIVTAGTPDPNSNFRYGLTAWQVEPVVPERGETDETALKTGSQFRQIVDAIDPQQAVVTFWVYPDSFALYRQLRDCLHDRDLVVAGRPLPEGMPIRATPQGSVSRGQ